MVEEDQTILENVKEINEELKKYIDDLDDPKLQLILSSMMVIQFGIANLNLNEIRRISDKILSIIQVISPSVKMSDLDQSSIIEKVDKIDTIKDEYADFFKKGAE